MTTATSQRLVVVTSGDGAPFGQVEAGIQKQGPAVSTLRLTGENAAALSATLARTGKDTAIVTLGTQASALVAQSAPKAPIVHCMAKDHDAARPSAGTLAVSADIPLPTQIRWMRLLLPGARSVGILYDPARNHRRAVQLAEGLRDHGIAAVLEPVDGPAALPSALNRLANRVDMLLAIPDSTVFAREHLRALLLFSFRNQIPLAGPTESWVSAGALYAIDWDYEDLGRYCAAMAMHQFAGPRTPPPTPARTRVVANLRTADQLRISWDDDVRRMLDRVFE